MYTKRDFGKELKAHVAYKHSLSKIAHWVEHQYIYWPYEEKDEKFLALLRSLMLMCEGPEFAYSYEELDKIADDLIAGKEVEL